MAALAAQAVGLDVAGIDLVAEDISKPLSAQGGAIVEVNAGPGLLMHLKPAEGLSRPVGRAIIDHIFPGDENGCIPLVGVTGSTGTGNIARLTAHLLNAHGWRTGLANTDGLYVGTRRLFAGDAANWDQARRLLLNKEVQAAVIENNGMEILTKGLAYDRCSVGIVTNVMYSETFKHPEVAFHAFETAEDLIKVYRSQVDVVWPHGVGVLNAEDPHVASMAQYCDGSIIFYSPSSDSPVISTHLAEGKRAVFIDQNIVITADGASRQKLISLNELSAYADPQNTEARRELLAAVAAAWALGVLSETIQNGLRSFK
jgi:cyanophycin synthetase